MLSDKESVLRNNERCTFRSSRNLPHEVEGSAGTLHSPNLEIGIPLLLVRYRLVDYALTEPCLRSTNRLWPMSQNHPSLNRAAVAARQKAAFWLCSLAPPRKPGYGRRIWLGKVPYRRSRADHPDSWNRLASMTLHHNSPWIVEDDYLVPVRREIQQL